MAGTRKPRVPLQEQIKLINECRKSGMTDADWCRENNITPSTFYNWLSRCRQIASDKIPQPSYGHSGTPRPKQDVVPVSIVHDQQLKLRVYHSHMLYALVIRLQSRSLLRDFQSASVMVLTQRWFRELFSF